MNINPKIIKNNYKVWDMVKVRKEKYENLDPMKVAILSYSKCKDYKEYKNREMFKKIGDVNKDDFIANAELNRPKAFLDIFQYIVKNFTPTCAGWNLGNGIFLSDNGIMNTMTIEFHRIKKIQEIPNDIVDIYHELKDEDWENDCIDKAVRHCSTYICVTGDHPEYVADISLEDTYKLVTSILELYGLPEKQ